MALTEDAVTAVPAIPAAALPIKFLREIPFCDMISIFYTVSGNLQCTEIDRIPPTHEAIY